MKRITEIGKTYSDGDTNLNGLTIAWTNRKCARWFVKCAVPYFYLAFFSHKMVL